MGNVRRQEQRIGPIKRDINVDSDTGLFVAPQHRLSTRILNFTIRFSRFATAHTNRASLKPRVEITNPTPTTQVVPTNLSTPQQTEPELGVHIQQEASSWTLTSHSSVTLPNSEGR